MQLLPHKEQADGASCSDDSTIGEYRRNARKQQRISLQPRSLVTTVPKTPARVSPPTVVGGSAKVLLQQPKALKPAKTPKKRKAAAAPEGNGSSRKKQSEKVCNHDAYEDFQSWDGPYYSPAFLEKKKDARIPRTCVGVHCGKTFFNGAREYDRNKEFKVTMKIVVRCCPNGINDRHRCVYALCANCYTHHVFAMDAKQKSGVAHVWSRKSRNLLSPGEKQAPNGDIVAM